MSVAQDDLKTTEKQLYLSNFKNPRLDFWNCKGT